MRQDVTRDKSRAIAADKQSGDEPYQNETTQHGSSERQAAQGVIREPKYFHPRTKRMVAHEDGGSSKHLDWKDDGFNETMQAENDSVYRVGNVICFLRRSGLLQVPRPFRPV